ncbi:hypothetical protein KFK09_011358 [Dendrobium nobile]|uniref:GTD-binding domain-containing protein n=1 Tax=Dendrobium nobile TaxID=94219 RepID=A0A8T3BCE5_DENNO|nr:hypothetical protein KFK09_011358 [Dendrobium nobile]
MAKGEIAALKEALRNQHLIIKKLYVELEEEREASSTAATEALSMILRLQREKAAEKMEACQYKRMAEERINHAEETLEVLEEVVQQKDLEIESLRFQLKANKQKQTNHGISIPDIGEMMLCVNKSCCNGIFRRNASLPSLRGDEFSFDKGFLDDESSVLSSKLSVWRKIGDFTNQYIGMSENEVDDLFDDLVASEGKPGRQYEAIELSRRDKGFLQAKNSAFGSCSSAAGNEVQSTSPIGSMASWFSAPVSDVSTDSSKRVEDTKSDNEAVSSSPSHYEDNGNASSLTRNFSRKARNSSLFHDIFGVPESHKDCKPGELCKILLQDAISETNSMIEMPNMMLKEVPDYLIKDDEGLNKTFMGNHNEAKLSLPAKEPIIAKLGKMCTPKKGTSVNYQWDLMDPGNGNVISYSDIEQLKRRLPKLEDERIILHEDSERGKKQLKEMLKQLNSIETHIKRSTSRKNSHVDESSLVSIMEAVLSFSI